MYLLRLSHRIKALHARAKEQNGAYTIEFLGVLTVVLLTAIFTVQVVVLMIQGILFNNALGLAAQQAAQRGAVDQATQNAFRAHLPQGSKGNLYPFYQNAGSRSGVDSIIPFVRSGKEPTVFGEVFCLAGGYTQRIPFAAAFIPGKSSFPVVRMMTVVSQSPREQDGQPTPDNPTYPRQCASSLPQVVQKQITLSAPSAITASSTATVNGGALNGG